MQQPLIGECVHVPPTPLQASVVHALPSLHESDGLQQPITSMCVHIASAFAQASVVQAFASVQSTAIPAMHVPLAQVSMPLQNIPSLQLVPFAASMSAGHVTAAPSQVSATSHTLTAARQTVLIGERTSAGHV